MIKGIDISHWNDSTTVKRAFEEINCIFCMIKVSEGKTYMDDMATRHLQSCYDNGVTPGFYHYARAEKNKAAEEAEHFVYTAKRVWRLVQGAIPFDNILLALDFEGKCFTLPPERQDAWAKEFCNIVYTKTGIKPLLYVQESKLKNFPITATGDYGLWCAKWSANKPKPSPWPFWAIWQNGKKMLTNGKDVDINVFNGSVEQLRRYGNATMG